MHSLMFSISKNFLSILRFEFDDAMYLNTTSTLDFHKLLTLASTAQSNFERLSSKFLFKINYAN